MEIGSALKNDFSLTDARCVQRLNLGENNNPVLVIDDFLRYPHHLCDLAMQGDIFRTNPTDYYPGIRKPVPGEYAKTISDFIQSSYLDLFQLPISSKAEVGLCAFSMVSTPQEQLRPIQSLPHFDNSCSTQLAVVHYLCPVDMGGTSFYRHKQTGYEVISENRLKTYAETLKKEVVRAQFQGMKYINESNQWFEKIGSVEARFNRVVIFNGNRLHAGNISPTKSISSDPEKGRLTINTFLNFIA